MQKFLAKIPYTMDPLRIELWPFEFDLFRHRTQSRIRYVGLVFYSRGISRLFRSGCHMQCGRVSRFIISKSATILGVRFLCAGLQGSLIQFRVCLGLPLETKNDVKLFPNLSAKRYEWLLFSGWKLKTLSTQLYRLSPLTQPRDVHFQADVHLHVPGYHYES